jgi:serine/threonine-protein kinase
VTTEPTVGETTRNLAEATREAGVASAAGAARGLGAVVRGLRDSVGPAGASERTLVVPAGVAHRTFRRGRNRRTTLVAGAIVLLLLALVAVVGAPALLSLGTGEKAERAADQPQHAAESSVETAAVASKPAPPPSEAERAVFDMYVKASYQNIDAVWAYLSQRLKDEVGSRERWAEQERLNTLRYVYFVRMPSAEVSGDTAKVRFQVREDRTGEPSKLVTGTWECVNENGEWKLDRLVEGNA